ncbi:PrpR N-terminal domain-containing protein [Fictibacillus enclensis]|uniref:sigma-54-dependent Fis family transcriptional regulator n=1 Tax=Fictibacillus enclensis TaxID=1017270 RepID=UPI0025A02ECF|nr:sigma-54-dependent transcriptional regulator [Fictibacillus enclensis]MDM5338595.1 PrpR N-terminal domain-containing protein [Fictibacillus enclensis]
MIKALVIVPYEGLFEMMKEIQHQVEDIQLDIALGNLHEGVAIAKEAEHHGYHVIISRGGTASMIKEAVSLPVIDIQVTGYDVLRIITLVKGFSRKAAIVGFSNITHGAVTICKLLDINIQTITITNDVEVQQKLSSIKELGCEVVIGDVVTVQAAKQLGLTGVLITSGKEAIIDALEEARRTYRIYSRLQQDVSLLQHVLDCSEQPIAVFNREKKIVYGNERFNKEFQWMNLENSPDIKKLIQEAGVERQTTTVHINHFSWKITAIPREDAIVSFFEKSLPHIEYSQGCENVKQSAIKIHTFTSSTPIYGKSELMKKVLQQIDQYSSRKEPIWINGEEGSGKELVAHTIYSKRKIENAPFVIVHCDVLSAKQLNDLWNEGFFRKFPDGVIYLNKIDKLNIHMQFVLYQMVKDEQNSKLQWIVSSEENVEESVKNGTFYGELYQSLGQLHITIPPLRERREDIEDLVPIFISDFHPKYGNSVVGVREDALMVMTNYDWPGNVDQLKQVIEQLYLQSNSYYIDREDVEIVLNLFQQQENDKDEVEPFDLSGTLEEIEKRVISKVLEEEGQNQSRAAKRLGINRSTLWRKLKQ